MEHVGHAALRVLGKARKAAKARMNDADAEGRDIALFKVADGMAPVARQHLASAAAGDGAGQERTRIKRPAGL